MRLFTHSCPACEGLEGALCKSVLPGRRALLGGLLALPAVSAPAVAQVTGGSTRRISLRRMQTGDSFDGIYWRDGRHDRAALDRLGWVMRDPRLEEATPMDPRLFDVMYMVQRRLDSDETWEVVSGYRAPESNAARARQSRRVATASLHMSGMAADCRLPGRNSLAVARAAADMQVGGVGLYRRDGFVHLDCGPSRRW